MADSGKFHRLWNLYEKIKTRESDIDLEDQVGVSDQKAGDTKPIESQSFISKHLRKILFVTSFLACCLIVGFIYGFEWNRGIKNNGVNQNASEEISQPSWRLDTQKNYTVDSSVWRAQKGHQNRHYFFNISKLVEVAPDGIKRNLTVINGQYPGPLIEANAGDTLFIHVNNLMEDEPTTIHCHGLLFNHENNYYDGASSINQCPISPGHNFTYAIELDEKQWGTYWYHSHYGAQYADGVFGPLVIHSEEEDQLLGSESKYDAEMVIMANDYYHDIANNYLADYLAPNNENNEPSPDDGLIQGANNFKYDAATYIVPNGETKEHDGEVYDTTEAKYPIMTLDKNKKYRIRLINAGFFLPFSFSIDEHHLSIIETDGANVTPTTVEMIDMSVAQRYSFILKKDSDNSDFFSLRVYFNAFCMAVDNPNFSPQIRGILSYDKSASTKNNTIDSVNSVAWQYNGGDPRCRDMDQKIFHSVNEKVPKVVNNTNRPDRIVKLDVSFFIKERQLDRGYFNDMTWKPLPDTENTLANLAFNNSSLRGGYGELESKNNNQYLINLDKRGEIVDFVINNYDDGSHPFHMHGYKFWLVGSSDRGYFKESYYEEDSLGLMNFDDAVQRDTINISGYGWAVIRIVVDNPGVWPFHCHIGWHMESGLLLQLNSLENEYTSWNHFPQEWKDLCTT